MRKALFFILLATISGMVRGQLIQGSFMHDGYIRVYDLHLPPQWFWSGSLPLLLDLHYLGADGRDQDSLSRFDLVADADNLGFVVCHPSGQGTDWNVGQAQPYSSGFDDVGFISALIDTLQARYNIDPQRVYASGMGQGGFMVHRLACELDQKIAAVAAVGASIADSTAFFCNSSRQVPIMVIHGTADSVVEYNTGLAGIWRNIPDLLSFWRTRNVCSGMETTDSLPDIVQEGSRIYTHRWTCGSTCELLHYEVRGGGFSWPGANRDLGSGGNRNMDINASQHIWDFLKRWSLSGLAAEPDPQSIAPLVNLYPQPAGDQLTLSMNSGRIQEVGIMDLNGRLLQQHQNLAGLQEITLDLQDLLPGIYLLRLNGHIRRITVLR